MCGLGNLWVLWRSRLIWRSSRIQGYNSRFEVLVKEYGRERLIFLKIVMAPGTDQMRYFYQRLAPQAAVNLSEALAEGAAKSRSWQEK